MNILGIDYGQAKIGLAIAWGPLAQPLKVIRYNDEDLLIGEIKKIADEEKAQKIVVGVSEGESARASQEFGEKLQKVLGIVVEFEDETLSTEDVMHLTREAGIKRKKRREMEDAYAATLILQNYIDR